MEAQTHFKIVSRIPNRYKSVLTEIADKAGFRSNYEIQQCLIGSVLRFASGEAAPEFSEYLLQPIERETAPEGFFKIVSRISEDENLLLDWICQRYGIKSTYSLLQRLALNYLRLFQTRAEELTGARTKAEMVSEEIAEEFSQLSDWEEMVFEKPKRRCPSLSVYSDCGTLPNDSEEEAFSLPAECSTDDLNEDSEDAGGMGQKCF